MKWLLLVSLLLVSFLEEMNGQSRLRKQQKARFLNHKKLKLIKTLRRTYQFRGELRRSSPIKSPVGLSGNQFVTALKKLINVLDKRPDAIAVMDDIQNIIILHPFLTRLYGLDSAVFDNHKKVDILFSPSLSEEAINSLLDKSSLKMAVVRAKKEIEDLLNISVHPWRPLNDYDYLKALERFIEAVRIYQNDLLKIPLLELVKIIYVKKNITRVSVHRSGWRNEKISVHIPLFLSEEDFIPTLASILNQQVDIYEESPVKCVFERPFIMGASISAGFSDDTRYVGIFKDNTLTNLARRFNIDFGANANLAMRVASEYIRGSRYAAKGISYYGSNSNYDSPTTQVATRTNLMPHISNISEIIVYLPHKQNASKQLEAILNLDPHIVHKVAMDMNLTDSEAFDLRRQRKYLKRLQNATVLASVDGFYWPSTEQNCENQIQEQLDGIDLIINTGKELNKPVILGTVPAYTESMMHSSIIGVMGQYIGEINFPQKTCYTRINAYMRKNCTIENGCYLLDIYQLMETAKQDDDTIDFENVKITFNLSEDGNYANDVYPIRSFEGMHLSPVGSRYMGTLIENLFIEGLKNPKARYHPSKVHGSNFPCSSKPVDLSDPVVYTAGYIQDSTYLSSSIIEQEDEVHRVSLTPLPISIDLNELIINTLRIGL